MSAGARQALARAISIESARPVPAGEPAGSGHDAPPQISIHGRAPRARACARLSSTTTPAPSPSTPPSRSNGRLACAGSSLRSDSSGNTPNEAKVEGVIGASAPAATAISTRPLRTASAAAQTASRPETQSVEIVVDDTFVPRRAAMATVTAFGCDEVTIHGSIRS
jgi:hypothetical protein